MDITQLILDDLAVAFATFEAVHYQGVRAVDKDPKAYVEANK